MELPIFEDYAPTYPRITEVRRGQRGRRRGQHPAPVIPGVPAAKGSPVLPNMLFLSVHDEEHKTKDVYVWIMNTSKMGPSALYGTSGCGKTRAIMEFLASNYGFYFNVTGTGSGVAYPGSAGADLPDVLLRRGRVRAPVLSLELLRSCNTLHMLQEVSHKLNNTLQLRGRVAAPLHAVPQLLPVGVAGHR